MIEDPLRVLITDDQRVVREGLAALIGEEEDILVVGQAADGVEAVEMAKKLFPDVVLMDLMMPHKDGIQATLEILRDNRNIKVLVLTSYADDEQVYQAIQAGALGYLMKDTSGYELLEAIRFVHRGESFLPPDIARKLVTRITRGKQADEEQSRLTKQEKTVLCLIARGLSNKDISRKLYISENTVYGHVANILSKLNLENRTQAALYAIRMGLTELKEDETP